VDMRIDERRRDQPTGSVNLARRAVSNVACDAHEFPILNSDIDKPGMTVQPGMANDEIKRHNASFVK
jgi:hypothetical protein